MPIGMLRLRPCTIHLTNERSSEPLSKLVGNSLAQVGQQVTRTEDGMALDGNVCSGTKGILSSVLRLPARCVALFARLSI